MLLATSLAGALTICAAATIARALTPAMTERMVSLTAGLMLATALLHNLPEAFESGISARRLLATLLGALFTFFLLEKSNLLRHRHDRRAAGSGIMVVWSDSLHNFSDGVLIAAAFHASARMGMLTGLAIVCHELPRRVGDFALLRSQGHTSGRAMRMNFPCMLMGMAGGIAGSLALERAGALLPYVLACSSAGFVYVVLGKLVPRMRRQDCWRDALPQVLLLLLGVGIVLCLRDSHAGG